MSSQSSKVEVLWSPNRDEEFALYGTELRLYAVQEFEGTKKSKPAASDISLSLKHYGKLLGILNSEIHCMPVHQCVAWQNSSTQPYFFAIGQSSGKVVLTNLGLDQSPSIPAMNHPLLVPKSGRPCTCLAWNPNENHLLAVGLDRARNDSSLIVWDSTRASRETATTPERSRFRFSDQSAVSEDSAKHFEFGHGEATTSMSWLPGTSGCLVAGMGQRFLRVFDIREGHATAQTHPRDVANHKAINGLCVDPTSHHQLASYTEGGTVYMWDLRRFQRPALTSFLSLAGRGLGTRLAKTYMCKVELNMPPTPPTAACLHVQSLDTVLKWTTATLNGGKNAVSGTSGSILRLGWVPTRPGCLSVILSEAPYLHLVDIPFFTYSPDTQVDHGELYIDYLSTHLADRCPYYSSSKSESYLKLSGVAWHSKWSNTCLIATAEGGVKQLKAFDKMPLTWRSSDQLMYGSSSNLFTAAGETFESPDEDISVKMKKRVKLGYGFDPTTNTKLLHNDHLLHDVWDCMQLQMKLVEKGLLPMGKTQKSLPGVFSILQADRPLAEGETLNLSKRLSWHDREGVVPTELPPFPMYTSAERHTALLLCGWNFGPNGQNLEDYLKREEMNEQHERAASIAVFQGQVRRGIASLKEGADIAQQRKDSNRANGLNLIALALSGYTPQETRLWHETCSGMKAQISNPYLRAAFNFLCSNGRDGFKNVLHESNMSLQDRVAFACTYLDDVHLHQYISQLTMSVISNGLINGLFLTGLTENGITLLTNYVNKVGDVQTACLIAGQVMSFAIRIKTVQGWFQGYRDLLDQWQMWHERALFDGQRKKLDPSFKPPRQTFVMCGFCSKSIASDSLRQDRRCHSSVAARKATSCPNCRKPLPRCSLCLLNMVASGNKQTKENGAQGTLDQWFTWCQSCRHGGHANHMAEWFGNHKECPVTGCTCHCFSLDTTM